MAEGRSNHGIAAALTLDPKTIEGHVTRIFSKLSLSLHRTITVACWRC